jgi:hypothetical protein
VGYEITVDVSYTDAQGTAESLTSSATSAVANVNDDPTGSVSISGVASEGRTLTAVTSSITDADGLGTFSYQWYADGSAISGATSSAYTLTSSEIGSTITVGVSYTDAQGTAESLASSATSTVVERTTSDVTVFVENRAGNSFTGATGVMYSADGDSPFYLKATSLGPRNSFELIAKPTVLANSLDFTIIDSNTLGTVTLGSSLSGWTNTVNTSISNEYRFSGIGALDNSNAFAANTETVVATFTTTGATHKAFDISLSNVSVGSVDLADQTFSASTQSIHSSNGGTFQPEGDAMVWLDAVMSYNNSVSRDIKSADALDALRLSVGMTTSAGTATAYDYLAADFNQDGRVTSADALEILKSSVGLSGSLSAEWIFVDSNADLTGINRRDTTVTRGKALTDMGATENVTLTAILVGDVNDSYFG